MTSETAICPHCEMALPAGGVAGLCPACLLRQGATYDSGLPSAFTPPSLEELTEWFPQLEILSLIGAGGMGAVYKTRQRELDRIVALKILPPGIGDRPGFAERFTLEAKALAKLSHPGIVTIHDTGRADGLYYLLMEFVDGLNLRQLIQVGRVAPREAMAIVPQICDALQYAHDAGIVHRDIKPENILLDRQGRVKVADFGLAKLVGTGDVDFSQTPPALQGATQAGQVMGTPQYMAPEQIQHPGEVDHRADIYALGVVFYQMLTGELPGPLGEPPSRKAAIDVRLDEVVLRALEKNPEHRYQQVSQIKEMVETIIATPAETQPKEPTPMVIKFKCPVCSQKLSTESTEAGATVECPNCTASMIVPSLPSEGGASLPTPHMPMPHMPMPPVPHFPQAPFPHLPQHAKGLALWSLVLGIVGIIPILGLATGLIGLALGIAALVKKTTRQGFAISGTILGSLAVLLIPFHLNVLKASMSGVKYGMHVAVCSTNLKAIGLAIAQYREKHNGMYPADLNVLVKEGFIAAATLRCPQMDAGSPSIGYEYSRPSGPEVRGILAWDRSGHRTVDNTVVGRNVLDTNLAVRFLTEQQFRNEPKAGQAGGGGAVRPDTPGIPQQPGPISKSPVTPRPQPPPVEEMTVARAIAALRAPSATDKRPPLRFLAEAPVDPESRDEVIASVKVLLSDVEFGDMAFQVFVAWADKEQVPELIEFVRVSPNSSRSKQSMKLLSRMGDARAAEPLAACLMEFGVARDAKAALAALGDIAKPALLPLYHHENNGAREAARELLRGYQATDEEILVETLKALSATSPHSKGSAMQYLTTANLPDEKRVLAARALHPLIIDPERWVRDAARQALKPLATPADADFLLEQMDSSDDATRMFAAELLVQFKDVRVAKPLAAQLSDHIMTWPAGNYLTQLGSSGESAVIPYLNHDDPNTRKRAAEILSKIGTKSSLPALEKALKDPNFFTRVAAENAINAIKSDPPAGNDGR